MKKNYYAMLPNIIVPLGGLSTDIYLPSLPSMADEFGVARASIQLTLTAYVMAMGFAQLLAGPMSDAWGRKKLILSALILQLLSVIGVMLASDVMQLIIARFAQGLGAAFMLVPARAILNDCFEGDDLKKQISYLTISFAIAPLIAPFIGGYCEHYWGWRSCFYILLAYISFLLVFIGMSFSETHRHGKKFLIEHLFVNYKQILSSKSFVFISLFLCTLFGYTSLSTALGPFIFQTRLGVSPVIYGYIALTLGFAWFAGNVFCRLLFSTDKTLKVCVSLLGQAAVVVTLLISSSLGIYNIFLTIFCLFVAIFFTAFLFPMFAGEALSIFPSLAASSNACLFSLTWVAFACFTLLATQISVQTLLPLSVVYLFIHIASLFLYSRLRKL